MSNTALTADAEPRYIRGKPHVSQWLYYQRDRKDSVGALARFAFADRDPDNESCWPHGANTVAHLIMHMRRKHGKQRDVPTEATLRAAFAEFRAFIDNGGRIPARPGGIRRQSNPNMHRGYVIPRVTIEHIKDIARHERVTQGGVIKRLVEIEHVRLFGQKKKVRGA